MIAALRLVLAGCAGLVLLADSRAQPAGVDEPAIGIWAGEATFRPALRGELTVVRDRSGWRATIAGAEATFQASGDAIRFSFPDHRGQFRGRLTGKGRVITGFWLQPAGGTSDLNDPGGPGQSYASPLNLQSAGRRVWRGVVKPLDDRFTLYLKIYRNSEGTLVGAFRDPDMNSNGGASLFRVTREGDAVQFSVRLDETLPEIRLNAMVVHSPERLQIFWPDLGRTIDLARRTPPEAADFFPRPPGDPTYAYRKPLATGDGWATARASEVGMDEAALARLVQRLIDADPAARRPPLIHSVLVAHHGKLVLEEYFFGFDRERQHDLRSAGKTFSSVMLGAAMMRGAKIAPETSVYNLLAGMGPFASPDPRKPQITLGHLMTHTSGLACDDNDDRSPGNEGTMQRQRREPDWWKYTLDLPMAHDPGTRYAYCSANINLVGAALTTATRTWLPELFDRTIARPLQFGLYYWNLMPTNEGHLGGGAYLRPRDLLKLGQVFLDGGVWQGRRIVDASWVTQSTAPRVSISPETTGLDAKQFPEFYNRGEDGYAWHLSTVRSGDRTYREYAATGNGGQLLIVVPELDLTVVFTAGNYRQGGIWGRFRSEIVPKEIIPAIH